MKKRSCLITVIFTLLLYTASAQTKLQAGVWRGVITNQTGNQIPFNFEVNNVSARQNIAIINGAERFKVDNITNKGDSVFIRMPLFDSEFRLKQGKDGLTGKWIRHLGDHNDEMAFKATPNTVWRFLPNPAKPTVNVTGSWAAVFGEGDKKDMTVGVFKQTGEKLTGTFLSITGDYRYLEGTVSGNQLYLSCFDGGHAYTFTATVKGQKMVDGKFYAGLKSITNWVATKNPNAKLPDAYSLTSLKPGYKKLAFTFKDTRGNKVSLTDSRFKNKVVIVQIMGSWCPNCMDETNYFVNDYYKKYHKKGVEIVGLAYERTTDFAKSQKTLAQLKARFNVPYSILITGYTNAAGEPRKSLPMLADFKGFPTTIVINKKGEVAKIHTGFSGPGTGNYYAEFTKEFEGLTDNLLAEK